MSFSPYIYQKIVCVVRPEQWRYLYGLRDDKFPDYHEICTIHNIYIYNNIPTVCFEKFGTGNYFAITGFKPLDEKFGEEVIEKIKSEIKKGIIV